MPYHYNESEMPSNVTLVRNILKHKTDSTFLKNMKLNSKQYIKDSENLEYIAALSLILYSTTKDKNIINKKDDLYNYYNDKFFAKVLKKESNGEVLSNKKKSKILSKIFVDEKSVELHNTIVNSIINKDNILSKKISAEIFESVLPTKLFNGIIDDVDNKITSLESFNEFYDNIYPYYIDKFLDYLTTNGVSENLSLLLATDEMEKEEILNDINNITESYLDFTNKKEENKENEYDEQVKSYSLNTNTDYMYTFSAIFYQALIGVVFTKSIINKLNQVEL